MNKYLLNKSSSFFICPKVVVQWSFSSKLSSYSSSPSDPDDRPHPFARTANILKDDFIEMKNRLLGKKSFFEKRKFFPHYCDVLIVGGGAMGYSTAYWLQERAMDNMRVVLVEKDCTYQQCTTTLSVGGVRQQFSLKENVELSMASSEFLRNIGNYLQVDGCEPPDVGFNPCGYLFLASETGAASLQENYNLQTSLGAKVELLSAEKLKNKFPFLNTDGIALGTHGVANEGWIDPWSLLNAFKNKAISLGVEVIDGTVSGFRYQEHSPVFSQFAPPGEYKHINRARVKLSDGSEKTIQFGTLIIAAGRDTGRVASMIGCGSGNGPLQIPIPIEPRKRYAYVIHCPEAPGLAMPFLIDSSGSFCRREGLGGNYVCGSSPDCDENEPPCDNFDVDYEFFENKVWPDIANRVPAFEKAKVKSAWSGYYDYNCLDQNAFVGPHPAFHNVYIVAGFSGHGIQQSPAVGRAVMEMIFDGRFKTIDLTRLGVKRLFTNEPLHETNIV